MSYVLGLDLGTGSLKGLLVNRQGRMISEASADYPLITEKQGYSEQKPQEWLDAATAVVKEILKQHPDAKDKIDGISVSGQMHSLVALDRQEQVLRNAILWNDVRTTKQCREITEVLGRKLLEITKNKALEGFTLPKILWLKENEPDTYSKIATFLLPKDYLGFWLTGEKNMEYSDAAGTLLLNVEQKNWSNEILDAFSIPHEICPPLVESTACIGTVRPEQALELGISADTKVYAGGADNACGALGAGILDSETAMSSIGTSGVFLAYEPDITNTYHGEIHFFNHAVKDVGYSMGVTLSAGNSLKWFRDTFAQGESYDDLLSNVSAIPVGSGKLLFTPYIMAERTPYADSTIRGSFVGIDVSHTRDHFARAVLEGITFSLKDSQKIMENLTNKTFKKIVSVGGGAKNKEWLQIQADIFNSTIVTLKNEQGPAYGSVMIAAVGCGWFDDFQSCAEVFVHYADSYKPNPENVEQYKMFYEQYKEIYSATKNICASLSIL